MNERAVETQKHDDPVLDREQPTNEGAIRIVGDLWGGLQILVAHSHDVANRIHQEPDCLLADLSNDDGVPSTWFRTPQP